jgi:hypothetical protein
MVKTIVMKEVLQKLHRSFTVISFPEPAILGKEREALG